MQTQDASSIRSSDQMKDSTYPLGFLLTNHCCPSQWKIKENGRQRKINYEQNQLPVLPLPKETRLSASITGWTGYFLWTVNWGLELRSAFSLGGLLIRSRCDKFGQAVTLAQRCRENVNTGQSIRVAKWVCAGSLREHLMRWCEFALGPEQTGRPAAVAARRRAAGLFLGPKYLRSSTTRQSEACYPERSMRCTVYTFLQVTDC